jgi:hypothetical protein
VQAQARTIQPILHCCCSSRCRCCCCSVPLSIFAGAGANKPTHPTLLGPIPCVHQLHLSTGHAIAGISPHLCRRRHQQTNPSYIAGSYTLCPPTTSKYWSRHCRHFSPFGQIVRLDSKHSRSEVSGCECASTGEGTASV